MDPDRIKRGSQRPYNAPDEKESVDKVDPEKFKKVMKVDESDETQKRNKRNLPKEEEEEVDKETPEKTAAPNPETSFSELMTDKGKLGHVFDKESGGIRRQTTRQGQKSSAAPPSGSISTEGVDLDRQSEPTSTNPSHSSKEPSRSQQPPLFQQQPERPASPQSPSQPRQNRTEQEQTIDVEQAQQGENKEGEPKRRKKGDKDSSLLASQPKTKDLKALKKKDPKGTAPEVKIVPGEEPIERKEEGIEQKVATKAPQKFERQSAPYPQEKRETPGLEAGEDSNGCVEAEKPATKKIPLGQVPKEKVDGETLKEGAFAGIEEDSAKEAVKKPGPFKRFSTEEARIQKIRKEEQRAEMEGVAVASPSGGERGALGGREKKKDEDFFLEADGQTAGVPLPNFENPLPAIIPPTDIPAYSKLSPEVYELFEKMGGVMTIQQDKGIKATTMNIDMPNSVFDGTQVILNQYSTAPNSFNIQLVGNPESVKIFNQNLDALKESFRQADFNFETNILNPILTRSKKSPHLIRRAKNAGDKGGRDDKNNG
ncbi:MAG: hypothetical protein AAGE99_04470 [Chlamydiota bacterium]